MRRLSCLFLSTKNTRAFNRTYRCCSVLLLPPGRRVYTRNVVEFSANCLALFTTSYRPTHFPSAPQHFDPIYIYIYISVVVETGLETGNRRSRLRDRSRDPMQTVCKAH